jgi:predicted PurR-regulated permease PerM
MVGGKLAGITGVLLAVPLLLTVLTVFTEYVLQKRNIK